MVTLSELDPELAASELVLPWSSVSSETGSDLSSAAAAPSADPVCAADAADRIGSLLRSLASGSYDASRARLLDLSYWRALADAEGLHVCSASPAAASSSHAFATPDPNTRPASNTSELRASLDARGYFCSPTPVASAETLRRLCAMSRRLRSLGFAPAFLYVFDEAWELLLECWRLSARVLGLDSPSALVLEPTVFAHALERPAAGATPTSSLQRYSYVGGNFGLPHRDHSSSDCFSPRGSPTLLSLWCPLNAVAVDNGCMHVVPKEFDRLLHRPEHPHHLEPHERATRRSRFDLAAAVSLAPAAAGAPMAWHGSSIHWGGACSTHSDAEPRVSLTAGVRRRDAPRSMLQEGALLPELEWGAAPPAGVEARLRHVAASLLVYEWWSGLGRGVVPDDLAAEAVGEGTRAG